MSRILNRMEYTADVLKCIVELEYHMQLTCTPYKEEDIIVCENEDDLYVLANPVLGMEPIFDELGRLRECVSLRNLTLICAHDFIQFGPLTEDGQIEVKIKMPALRVMRPDLCVRLSKAVPNENSPSSG